MGEPVVTTDPELAADVLRRGGLVAFPTETVYGLGADAGAEASVRRVFAVKGRPADHPLIVHLADAQQLGDWADPVPADARALAEAFWPGPLTLLVPRAPSVLDAVTGGRPSVGVRVPAHPLALALLEQFGRGVAAPSANRFGRVSPTTAEHVVADLDGDVDLVLDGGACRVGVESTIVDLTGPVPEIVRRGALDEADLAAVLGRAPAVWAGAGAARAPGMLPAHYAPRASVVLVAADDVAGIADRVARYRADGRVVAVLGLAEVVERLALPDDGVAVLEPPRDADEYAQVLYRRLREADIGGADVVIAVPPAGPGVALAVADRLWRAASAR